MAITCGFTNLSFVQAHEWVGTLFVLVTLAQTTTGWNLLDKALKKGNNCGIADVLNVLEAILCFDAWLHQDKFWTHQEEAPDAEQRSVESIQMLMNMCHLTFPEEWHVIKFHMLLHFPHFITQFGPPNNYDSQRPEHSHISHAKKPGRRAHKTHSGQKFEIQVGQRMADAFVIQSTHERIADLDSSTAIRGKPRCLFGSFCRISLRDNQVNEVWNTDRNSLTNTNQLKLFPGVAEFLLDHFDCEDVLTCTEMRVNNSLHRCHRSPSDAAFF